MLSFFDTYKYTYNGSIWVQALVAHHDPRMARKAPGRRLEMGLFMFRNRACEATDPRDRVYGLHGLLQRFRLNLPQSSSSKTKGEMYWEFTVIVCQQTSSLEPLTLVSSINEDRSIPSWVPDYSEVFNFCFTHSGRRLIACGIIIDVVLAKSDLTAWQPDPISPVVDDGPTCKSRRRLRTDHTRISGLV